MVVPRLSSPLNQLEMRCYRYVHTGVVLLRGGSSFLSWTRYSSCQARGFKDKLVFLVCAVAIWIERWLRFWLVLLSTGTCGIMLLWFFTFINRKWFKAFPLPGSLFVMIAFILISYIFKIDQSPSNVPIIGEVPSGFPRPQVFNFDSSLVFPIFKASILYSIVYFFIHISIARSVAHKGDFTVSCCLDDACCSEANGPEQHWFGLHRSTATKSSLLLGHAAHLEAFSNVIRLRLLLLVHRLSVSLEGLHRSTTSCQCGE